MLFFLHQRARIFLFTEAACRAELRVVWEFWLLLFLLEELLASSSPKHERQLDSGAAENIRDSVNLLVLKCIRLVPEE